MTASDFSDTFFWKARDMEDTDGDNFDTIYGFNPDYDVLNIGELLKDFGFDADEDILADWVEVQEVDGDILILIDPDGDGKDSDFTKLVLLQGVESFDINDIIITTV